jgi:nicotinamide N-methyltransferase
VHALPSRGFDYVLLADTVWASSSLSSDDGSGSDYSPPHAALVRSLVRTLSPTDPHARALVVCGFHTGRAAVQAFFERAEQEGLVPDEEWGRQEWGWSSSIMTTRNEQEDEDGKGGKEREWTEEVKKREWRDGEPVVGDDKGRWIVLARLRWKR